MGYLTRTEIGMIVDGEDLTQYAPQPGDEIDHVLDAARTYLDSHRYATDDLLASLTQAMRDGWGDFGKMFSPNFEELFVHLSAEFPAAVFRLRCIGEEFKDVYLREFTAGKMTFAVGPFET